MEHKTDIIGETRRFLGQLREHRSIDPLWLGFSGGADSTALALALQLAGQEFTAVHIHHHIRGKEADADAEWCEAFCRQRKIPFRRMDVDVPSEMLHGEGLEQAARRCRHCVWAQLLGTDGAAVLAHHLDDCLENLFLRLARGSNCSGLTGLRPIAQLGGVTFLRPFLSLRRAQLEVFLRENGMTTWREDGTNADTALRRNAVRHHILPTFQRIFLTDGGLVKALQALGDDAEFLEAEAEKAHAQTQTLLQWRALPPALLGRVLRLWLAARTGADAPLRAAGIERLQEALAKWDGKDVTVPLGNGCALRLHQNGLCLQKAVVDLPTRTWNWGEEPELYLPETGRSLRACATPATGPENSLHGGADAELFDAAAMPPELHIRSWRPGDRMICFGAATAKKVQDIFVDDHVPRDERSRIPVLLAGDRIIWLVGVRRGEFGRVSDAGSDTIQIALC